MARALVRCGSCRAFPFLVAAMTVMSMGHGPARADEPEKAKELPEQIVDTMNKLFGKHPGFRAAHAKGIVCEGEFAPTSAAATLSRCRIYRGSRRE